MSPSFLNFFYLALYNKTVTQNYTVKYPIEETKRRIRTHLLETKRYTPSYFKNPSKGYYGRFSGLECRRISIQKIHRPKFFRTNTQYQLGIALIAKCYLPPNEDGTKISVKYKSYSSYLIWGITGTMLIFIGLIFITTSIWSSFNFKAFGVISVGLILLGIIQAFVHAIYLYRTYNEFNSLFERL